MQNNCRFGDNCFYSHDLNDRESTVCRYFLQGCCMYGDSCFYDHSIKTEKQSNLNSQKNIPKSTTSNERDNRSYNQVVTGKKESNDKTTESEAELCPYFEKKLNCPLENCDYIHGDICEYCNTASLHPFNKESRDNHIKQCVNEMERNMEEAFAAQRSAEKSCGICMDVIWDKEKTSDQRFGILENCDHVFCLPCIRKWRSSKSYDNKIVK